jgi:hypothetical protein
MKVKESKQTNDYQSDIYEARVKIAETRWESGHIPAWRHEIKEVHIEKH